MNTLFDVLFISCNLGAVYFRKEILHPSQTAIDYIWFCFFENYISAENFSATEEVCNIQKALVHRPFNPDSDSHQKFLSSLNDKIVKLKGKFTHFKF